MIPDDLERVSDVLTAGLRKEINQVLAEVERTVCRWDPGK